VWKPGTHAEGESKQSQRSIDGMSGEPLSALKSEWKVSPVVTEDAMVLTGLSLHVPSTPSSDSQLSAPMEGRILEAKSRIASRYNRASNTGLGSVLTTKLTSVSK